MVIPLLLPALAAFLLCASITPMVSRMANAMGALDLPAARKIHAHPIPRMGGVGIAAACIAGMLVGWILGFQDSFPTVNPLRAGNGAGGPEGWLHALLLGGSLGGILLLGAADDVRERSASRKLAVQLLLGVAVHSAGLRVSGLPGLEWMTQTPAGWVLDVLATCLWMAAACNAMNLVDGMDGLASGTALLTSTALIPLTWIAGEPVWTLLLSSLAGALIGFLYWNRSPSVIFLGDSGSLSLGWLLGAASLSTASALGAGSAADSASAPMLWAVPPLLFAYPLLDTAAAILRRMRPPASAASPATSPATSPAAAPNGPPPPWHRRILLPDRSHLHHRLLAGGHSPKEALARLLVLHGVFASLALLTAAGAAYPSATAWLPSVMAGLAALGVLHYGTVPPKQTPPQALREDGALLLVSGHHRDAPLLGSAAGGRTPTLILNESDPGLLAHWQNIAWRLRHGMRALRSPWDLGHAHRRRPIRLALIGTPLPKPGDQKRLREQLRRLRIPSMPLAPQHEPSPAPPREPSPASTTPPPTEPTSP